FRDRRPDNHPAAADLQGSITPPVWPLISAASPLPRSGCTLMGHGGGTTRSPICHWAASIPRAHRRRSASTRRFADFLQTCPPPPVKRESLRFPRKREAPPPLPRRPRDPVL